jgi:hypothetical protein
MTTCASAATAMLLPITQRHMRHHHNRCACQQIAGCRPLPKGWHTSFSGSVPYGSLGRGVGRCSSCCRIGPVIQALEVATAPCFGRSASFMDDSATVQNEQRVYVTRSDGGTWLFVPDPNVPTAKPETQSAKRRGWPSAGLSLLVGSGRFLPSPLSFSSTQSSRTPCASLSGRSGGTENSPGLRVDRWPAHRAMRVGRVRPARGWRPSREPTVTLFHQRPHG